MVPLSVIGAWHEEQVDELFMSLLGKGHETHDNNGAMLQNGNDTMTGSVLMSVFG